MHNLKANFDKIKPVCKRVLKKHLLKDGNVGYYPNKPQMTDIEVITLAVMSEYLSISSENCLFIKLKCEYERQFPRLISRARFNIRRRKLQWYINEVAVEMANLMGTSNETLIIDSAPVPICENARILRSKVCKDDPEVQPDRGWNAVHKHYYYGFKLQLILTERGVPIMGSLYPASCHDTHALKSLNEIERTDCELLADRGYLSAGLQTSLFNDLKIKLITPLRSNMKRTITQWNASRRYKRKRIETTFSQLLDQFNLRKHYAKTLDGLISRILTKIAAISIAQFINHQNNKPLNHIKYALAF